MANLTLAIDDDLLQRAREAALRENTSVNALVRDFLGSYVDARSKRLAALNGFEVVPTDSTLVLDAHQLACREQLSWFDALISEAAIRNRCDVLFSEDFCHGRVIAAMQIRNPLLD